MNTNNNITDAVSAINAQRKTEAICKAKSLVLAIVDTKAVIAAREKSLADLNASLLALAKDKYNAVEILGTLPTGIAAQTVTDTISELNQYASGEVAERCSILDQQIRVGQSNLRAEQDNLASLVARLGKVQYVEVTPETIG